MDFAKIRPRGGTKAQWEKANPVLAKREIGVQWETTIGVGEVVIKIGDGVTDWINLPEAVKSDITKKIIAALAVVPDDDPDLADGDSLDTLFGKIAKKFKYLKDNKLDKSARYDGTDSTSTELVPTANALRGVNAKADKNASDITTINNNLSNSGIPIVKKITDLYSIKTSGFYYYDAGTTNAPQSSRGGMIIANYLSDSWISLIVVPYASSKIYTNTKYNNTWVGWAESATKDDLAAKLELISSDNLPFKANTIQPNSNVTFTFKPTLPSGYILVGACVKDTKSLDNKVVPVYCNASSSNGTNTINLRLLNISNDVVSITANMGITFYLFVKK